MLILFADVIIIANIMLLFQCYPHGGASRQISKFVSVLLMPTSFFIGFFLY